MRLITLAASLLALFLVEIASAKSMWKPNFGPAPFPIEVKVIRTYGSGCPAGTISATLSPDQTSVSILFDQLGTNLPASSVLVQDRKTCAITLGVKFHGQHRVAIVGSDIRGFASVPANARSSISVQHQSIYGMGQKFDYMNFSRNLVGPTEQNIEMINRFGHKPLWSQCGTQMRYGPTFPFMTIVIDVNSQQANADQDLIAAIDSFDFTTSPLSYQIAWTIDRKNCPR